MTKKRPITVGGSESGIKPLAGLLFLILILYAMARAIIGAI